MLLSTRGSIDCGFKVDVIVSSPCGAGNKPVLGHVAPLTNCRPCKSSRVPKSVSTVEFFFSHGKDMKRKCVILLCAQSSVLLFLLLLPKATVVSMANRVCSNYIKNANQV